MIPVRRRDAPPASLTEAKSWRSQDVLDALFEDFRGKCWLTETPLSPGGFEVDHFEPRGQGGANYDWDNLFPIHPDTNGRRKKKMPPCGMLNPCCDDVDRIEQTWDEERPVFYARDPQDATAVFTAEELDRLHNDNSAKARDLRDAITKRVVSTLEAAVAYYRTDDLREKEARRYVLRRNLSNRGAFTALVRAKLISLQAGIADEFPASE